MPKRHTTLKGMARMGMRVANCTPPPMKRRCKPPASICASQWLRTTAKATGLSNCANWQSFNHCSKGVKIRSSKRWSASPPTLKNRATKACSSCTHWLGVWSCESCCRLSCTSCKLRNKAETTGASRPSTPVCENVSCQVACALSVTPKA